MALPEKFSHNQDHPQVYTPQQAKKYHYTPQIAKQLTRDAMYKDLGLGADTEVAKTSPLFDPRQFALPSAPTKESNPVFDIPILGPALDLLDTPRAGIVSAIKEFGDIFDDEESFSLGDWWEQTGDNIFMGEVLRDWGVDLPGPLDFALGLTLDIAFDPLTYLLPLGAWARVATKPQMVKHLKDAANAAKYGKVKDAAKATRMEDAAARVAERGSFAAGKDVLEELGLPTAIKFSVPLTGRIGQGIFERPLRNIPGVGQRYAAWANAKRVGQLKPINTEVVDLVDKAGRPLKALDDAAIQTRVLKAVNELDAAKRAGTTKQVAERIVTRAPKTGEQVVRSARTAQRMPIEAPFKLPIGFGVLAVVAGLPGKAMGQAQKSKMVNTLSEGLSTRFHLNQMYRSGDINQIENALWLEGAANRGLIKDNVFRTKHTQELGNIARTAREADIDFDDIFRGANEKMGSEAAGRVNVLLGPVAKGGSQEVQDIVVRLQKWFDEVLRTYNEALPWQDDLPGLLSEMYVTRQIHGKDLDLVYKNAKSVRVQDLEGLSGSPFKNRELVLPDEIKAQAADGYVPAAEQTRIASQYGMTFEEVLDAGLPVQVTTTDGRVLRSHFMGEGFLPYDQGGSVLTQMDTIGTRNLGSDYRKLFTEDANLALSKYLQMMGENIRAQSIVGDLSQAGIIVKANDAGLASRYVGRKVAADIQDAKGAVKKTQRAKQRIEKRVAAAARVISKYAEEPIDELVAAQPRNRKGSGTMRPRTAAAVDELANIEAQMVDVESALTALIEGTADNLTAGARRLLASGDPEQIRIKGQFGPKLQRAVPPEGTAKEQRALRKAQIAEEDIASATEELVKIREDIHQLMKAHGELQIRMSRAGAGTNQEFVAEVQAMGEYLQLYAEDIERIAQNYVANVLELSENVQAARILSELGEGLFGDIQVFKRNPSVALEDKLDAARNTLKETEAGLTPLQTVDVPLGGGSETKAIVNAYKEANPDWASSSSMTIVSSGGQVTLKNVGELQLERFQRFVEDYVAQRSGTAVQSGKPLQKAAQEPSTWSGAKSAGAENWPAQYVDDVNGLIAEELAAGSTVKFSTGPSKAVGVTGGRVRPTDGGLTEFGGESFTISKRSDAEWVVNVDGDEIPITGPRASATTGKNSGEQGLVVWLPRQQRSIYFNPTPKAGTYAQNVKKGSKQQVTASRNVGKKIEDALDQRATNIEKQEQLIAKEQRRVEELRQQFEGTISRNVYEHYRLAQFAGSEAVSPVPAKSVVERVAVRMPAREVPAPPTPKVQRRDRPVNSGGVHRLADGAIEVDGPKGSRVRLTGQQAEQYLADRAARMTARGEPAAQMSPRMEPGGVVERDVVAVNAHTDELWVYADSGVPTPKSWYYGLEEPPVGSGPKAETTLGNVDRPLFQVRPTDESYRLADGTEIRVYEAIEMQPKSTSRFDLVDQVIDEPMSIGLPGGGSIPVPRPDVPVYKRARSADRQFRSRQAKNGWVYLDDFDAVDALEAGTYVPPSPKMPKRTTAGEQKVIEQIFSSEPYREWIKLAQEVRRLQTDLFEAEKFLLSNMNAPQAVIENATQRSVQAVEQILDARITALEDQIRAGVKGKAGAVKNRETVRQLQARKEYLEEQKVKVLQEVDNIREWLAEVVPELRDALQTTKIDEAQLAVVEAGIAWQQQYIRNLSLDLQRTLDDVQAGTVKRMDAALNQKEALKVLRNARERANLSAAYEEYVEDYLITGSTLGKSSERSSRTRQHLKGYQLVGATDETVELFEAAFESMARLRDPIRTKEFMTKYDKVINYWKAQAVATPGFVFRNLLGGTWINNQIAGVPVSYQLRIDIMRRKALKVAAEDGRQGDVAYGARKIAAEGKSTKAGYGLMNVEPAEWDVMADWAETGMGNTGITSMEVNSAINDMGMSWREAGTINPVSRDFYLFAAIGRLNQRAEFTLRGSLAHHVMMNGGSREEALNAVYKYHFDYGNLTALDQKIKRVIPFWTWQKNILPVLLESFGKRPQAWARLVQVKGELELTSDKEGLVPDYFGENMAIRLPFTAGGNRVYAMPDLPFRDLARYLKSPTSPARSLIEGALPHYKLPIELWAKKRTFADIPFTGRYQQVPIAIEKLPGAMQLLGAFGKAEKNKAGQWKMRDQDIYIIEQLMPILGRARRLAPNEEAKQKRLITTYLSTFLGLGVRTNTPQEKRNQLIKDRIKYSQDMRDVRDLMGRSV